VRTVIGILMIQVEGNMKIDSGDVVVIVYTLSVFVILGLMIIWRC